MEELAKFRGLRKFFLIGRNAAKLDIVADRLRQQFNCDVRTCVQDFESTEYRKLAAELGRIDVDIGILINCAGIFTERVGNFSEQPVGTFCLYIFFQIIKTFEQKYIFFHITRV